MKSNERTKKDILEQLEWNDAVDARKINVEVKGKKVTLTGTTSNYSAKIIAARDVLQVAPGFELDNQITVDFHPEEPVPADTEIIENIQNFLKWNSNINPVHIRVDVEKGWVTLSGSVSAAWEKMQAEKIAVSSRGVTNVINKITVTPYSIPADSFIKKNIKRALERSALVDEDRVAVEVDKGVVTLTGAVASEPIVSEIYEKAISTNGVVDVVNNLSIG